MTWRVAQALLNLRDEVDKRFPDRDHASDGSIGNKAHQAKGDASDHNPFVKDSKGIGVVRAIDVDAGPGLNPDKHHDAIGRTVAEAARQAGEDGHPALEGGGYVIFQGKIASPKSNPPWSWRDFDGDPHKSHVHISVGLKPAAYDNKQGWKVRSTPRGAGQPHVTRAGGAPVGDMAFPELKVGSKGDLVKLVQRFLLGSAHAKTLSFYGTFEAKTEVAVKGYQRLRGLTPDGKVGPNTWAPIRKALNV
jgi:hypothetical protein